MSKMATCKNCGLKIDWQKNANGKFTALNADGSWHRVVIENVWYCSNGKEYNKNGAWIGLPPAIQEKSSSSGISGNDSGSSSIIVLNNILGVLRELRDDLRKLLPADLTPGVIAEIRLYILEEGTAEKGVQESKILTVLQEAFPSHAQSELQSLLDLTVQDMLIEGRIYNPTPGWVKVIE